MKAYYTVELSECGCEHCDADRVWDVVAGDGVALGTSYGDRGEAEEVAEMLNEAYQRGLSRWPELDATRERVYFEGLDEVPLVANHTDSDAYDNEPQRYPPVFMDFETGRTFYYAED